MTCVSAHLYLYENGEIAIEINGENEAGINMNIGIQDESGLVGITQVCNGDPTALLLDPAVFVFARCPNGPVPTSLTCTSEYAGIDDSAIYRYIPSGDPHGHVIEPPLYHFPTDITGSFGGSSEFELAVDLSAMNGGAGFPFYGTSYTSAVMDLNGKLLLGSTGPLVGYYDDGRTGCTPNGIPQPMIMVAYDNLEDGGYAIGFESTCPRVSQFGGSQGCMVIVWANVEHYYDDFKKRGVNPPWEYVSAWQATVI